MLKLGDILDANILSKDNVCTMYGFKNFVSYLLQRNVKIDFINKLDKDMDKLLVITNKVINLVKSYDNINKAKNYISLISNEHDVIEFDLYIHTKDGQYHTKLIADGIKDVDRYISYLTCYSKMCHMFDNTSIEELLTKICQSIDKYKCDCLYLYTIDFSELDCGKYCDQVIYFMDSKYSKCESTLYEKKTSSKVYISKVIELLDKNRKQYAKYNSSYVAFVSNYVGAAITIDGIGNYQKVIDILKDVAKDNIGYELNTKLLV